MSFTETNGLNLENETTSGKGSDYERLRAWYLAYLRKSQLVGDIAGDVTPATLIKRDREALEKLIAETTPAPVAVTGPAASDTHVKIESPFRRTIISLSAANVFAIGWLFFAAQQHLVVEISQALGISLMLGLSTAHLVRLSIALQRKHAKLQAVTMREQAIADYAYEALWSLDEKFDFIAINIAGEKLLGTRYQFMNKSFFAALPPTEHERVKSALAKAKQQKQPEQVETQVKRSDGTVIDIELSAEYSESDIVFYCVARDISERKEIESIKEQLMAMLSHDLKTPLSSLKFSLALLNSADYGKLTEDGENIRRIGENNVERLIQLINQLLDLHRLDANQLKLNLKDVSVSEIIKPALEAIENLAEQKSMDVTIDADEATVHADKDRMVQVIINLLSNAIKYSPAETNIRLEVKSLPGDWLVEFRVSDSGPGIAKEHKQAVFDRFFRVVSEDGKTPEGSGLGLAICKAIVEAHGGKIDVENNSPNGSSFFCHLPAAKDKTAA